MEKEMKTKEVVKLLKDIYNNVPDLCERRIGWRYHTIKFSTLKGFNKYIINYEYLNGEYRGITIHINGKEVVRKECPIGFSFVYDSLNCILDKFRALKFEK